jgi:hypothetical protein
MALLIHVVELGLELDRVKKTVFQSLRAWQFMEDGFRHRDVTLGQVSEVGVVTMALRQFGMLRS